MGMLRILSILVVSAFLLTGCVVPSSTSQGGLRNGEKAIAKVVSVTVVAAVRFRDAEAMNHLTSSASEAAGLGFVLVFDEKGSTLSAAINGQMNARQHSIIKTVQERIRQGEKEFEIQESGLRVSVVPVELEGESLVGYVAVASL